MTNKLRKHDLRRGWLVGALAVMMTFSTAAFGCSTNDNMTSSATELRAGGSITPVVTVTPGTSPRTPMVSGAVDASVDALAIQEARRGYRGRVLGPAAPGKAVVSRSSQMLTGQFVSPAALVNPIHTVNSSIHSDPVPALPSDGPAGLEADLSGFVAAAATVGGMDDGSGLIDANANFGVTGVSNTTATGIAGVTSAATNIGTGNNIVVSTGAAAAPATSGNVLATRNLGTAPGLNTDLTAVGGGVFARSGLPGVNANGLATATGSVSAPSTVSGTRSGSITGSAKAGSVRAVSGKGGAILLTNQGAAATAKGGTK